MIVGNRVPPQNDDEILEAFADLLDHVRPETPEEVRAILLEAGLDPDEIVAEGRQLIQDGLANSPYNWRNAQKKLAQARADLESSALNLPLSREEIIAALRELLTHPRVQSVGAHFRSQNLSDMPDEEIASLYQELRYLVDQDSQDAGNQKK
jgi:hypothetical protein